MKRMSEFNKREMQLINMINEAKLWVGFDNELEIDRMEDGWYACEYIPSYGSVELNYEKYKKPLITHEEIKKYSINIYSILDKCNVLYCG